MRLDRSHTASFWASLLAAAMAVGCVATDEPAEDNTGVFSFALTGVIPGIKAMDVKVFAGPVTSMSKLHKFELACIPYVTGANKSNNAFTLDKLPARNDYSIMVNLYGDDACNKLAVRAYRGGIEVAAGTRATAADAPYYIQPYRLGAFTGLATANPLAKQDIQKLSCTTDSDCKGDGGHPAATCQNNKCSLSSLFPLNGGSPRAFPTVASLSNGKVAVSGGFSVLQKDGVWAATKDRVEIFDPSLGRFEDTALAIDNFGVEARVGMASSLAWDDSQFVQVGGTSRLKLTVAAKKVVTGLEDGACDTPSACPASKAVWLVDPAKKTSSGTLVPGNVALPIVARVATPAGPRVLVAGGAELPIQGKNVVRRGGALLCEVSAGASSCKDSAGKMVAGRADAAWACIETSASGCKKLLILGGRKSGAAPLAEVYDATKDAFETVTVKGKQPQLMHGGQVVRAGAKFYVVGTRGRALFFEDKSTDNTGPIEVLAAEVDDSKSPVTLTMASLDLNGNGGTDGGKRSFAAAIGYDDGSAVVAGGLSANNTIMSDALVIDSSAKVIARVPLEQPRYGGTIGRISAEGPLKDCALLAGGIATTNGNVAPVNHVEVFCPTAK